MTTKAHFFLDPRRGGSYADRVRATFGDSLWALYLQNESSGSVARNSAGIFVDGAYTGATLADAPTPVGTLAPRYDALEDYTNIYQGAGFDATAQAWSEGTAILPLRVSGAGVWSDATARYLAHMGDSAVNNRLFHIGKHTVNNQLRCTRTVGGVSINVIATVDTTGNRHLDWIFLAMTWSVANNRLRAWISYRGVAPAQFGTTQTGVTAFGAITMGSGRCAIGTNDIVGPSAIWDGWIGPVVLGNRELNFATELAPLMVF